MALDGNPVRHELPTNDETGAGDENESFMFESPHFNPCMFNSLSTRYEQYA
jgi:hypothetical protein